MTTQFIYRKIWSHLQKEALRARRPTAVAVAYFGSGANRLLPLPKGSRLVVDASERAVASGQTCPKDLLSELRRGVSIFSVPNLHAKVFVFDGVAFVGSTNASTRSATQLVEATVRTTDRRVLTAARAFVLDHCLHELTPQVLKQLSRLYKPPKIPGSSGNRRERRQNTPSPTLPRILLAKLRLINWSEEDQKTHDAGMAVAMRQRSHPRRFVVDSFRQSGRCPYRKGDVVLQVTKEDGGTRYVSAPGTVLHVRVRRSGARTVSFVYLELPERRRRTVIALAKALGGQAAKQLQRGGVVRDVVFGQRLLNAWAR